MKYILTLDIDTYNTKRLHHCVDDSASIRITTLILLQNNAIKKISRTRYKIVDRNVIRKIIEERKQKLLYLKPLYPKKKFIVGRNAPLKIIFGDRSEG